MLEVLIAANSSLKTEKWRYDGGTHKLYQYSLAQKAYLFHSHCSRAEYQKLAKGNKYI
jgi:hypothetical protein